MKQSHLSKFLDKNPPPYSSDADNFEGMLEERIKKIVTPTFLKEIFYKESLTMPEDFKKIYQYRPNNYSIKIPLKHSLSLVQKEIEGVKLNFKCKEKPMKNWTGLIIDNYHGCTVEINTKCVIFYLTEKIERLVPYPHSEEAIMKIKKTIEDRLVDIAKRFQKETKIKLNVENWDNHRKEIEIKGDLVLDNIPKDMNIHAENFKKVYEKGVEFFDEASVVNYINNRALEDLSPEMVKELIEIKKLMASGMTINQSIANTQVMIVQLLKKLEEKS